MLEQQLQIEKEMSLDANRRLHSDNFKTNNRGVWSESTLGIRYTTQATRQFFLVVSKAMQGYESTKARVSARGIKLLVDSGLEPETVAYLFCKAVYNQLPLVSKKPLKRVTFCIRAAGLLHDEMRVRHFAQAPVRKALLRRLFETFDRKAYPREWRRRTIKNYFDSEQLSWNLWSPRERLVVGYTLLVLFRDSTGLLIAPRNSSTIEPTPELLDHLKETMENRVLDFLLYKPMVVKPRPWSQENMFRGGYLSDKVKTYPLVKGTSKKDLERFERMDLSKVLPAINALQETPFRVNKRMLDVLEWSMNVRGGNIAGLPRADEEPLPLKPPGYKVDEKITKDHNLQCFLIRSRNREIKTKRMMVVATIAVARQFKSFRELFFPHQLDSRGRAYPVPAFLNVQGPDYCKSLLEFSHGVAIENDRHACWLAIAGANAYGNDKVSLQERVDWVQDNEEMIFSIARDPKHDLRWTTCSEPFMFLRFCLEWFDFWEHGYGYVSHMVTHADATCSGLQHYSMALRDPVGGRSVNLIPGLPRQDIYGDVAQKVIEKLFRESNQLPVECSNLIKLGIDRKITKRTVMVAPYAGTFASCMAYTREAIQEKLKAGHLPTWNTKDKDEDNKHVVLLSKLVWESIDEVVIKGKEAMRWLTKTARDYSKWANQNIAGKAFDKRMSWVTPDGFEAVHYRADSKEKRVATFLDGRVDLAYREELDRLSPEDMATAVAPNWVHSLDACLMRMAVIKGRSQELPILHYAMIHDSFGVHASKMQEFLDKCVKPAFIEMYRENVLQQFADRIPKEIPLEPLPEQGDLDPNGVMDSEFFFS